MLNFKIISLDKSKPISRTYRIGQGVNMSNIFFFSICNYTLCKSDSENLRPYSPERYCTRHKIPPSPHATCFKKRLLHSIRSRKTFSSFSYAHITGNSFPKINDFFLSLSRVLWTLWNCSHFLPQCEYLKKGGGRKNDIIKGIFGRSDKLKWKVHASKSSWPIFLLLKSRRYKVPPLF